jgi:hypothetical protein
MYIIYTHNVITPLLLQKNTMFICVYKYIHWNDIFVFVIHSVSINSMTLLN